MTSRDTLEDICHDLPRFQTAPFDESSIRCFYRTRSAASGFSASKERWKERKYSFHKVRADCWRAGSLSIVVSTIDSYRSLHVHVRMHGCVPGPFVFVRAKFDQVNSFGWSAYKPFSAALRWRRVLAVHTGSRKIERQEGQMFVIGVIGTDRGVKKEGATGGRNWILCAVPSPTSFAIAEKKGQPFS